MIMFGSRQFLQDMDLKLDALAKMQLAGHERSSGMQGGKDDILSTHPSVSCSCDWLKGGAKYNPVIPDVFVGFSMI